MSVFTPFNFLTRSHSFFVGVSAVRVLQKFRQVSLLVFLIILFALAVHLLSSIVFAMVGLLSALFLAHLLSATALEHSLFHHGLKYLVLIFPLVFLNVVSAASVKDFLNCSSSFMLSLVVLVGVSFDVQCLMFSCIIFHFILFSLILVSGASLTLVRTG